MNPLVIDLINVTKRYLAQKTPPGFKEWVLLKIGLSKIKQYYSHHRRRRMQTNRLKLFWEAGYFGRKNEVVF